MMILKSELLRKATEFLRDVVYLLMPRRCCVCGEKLSHSEQHVCTQCMLQLPKTRFHGAQGNNLERGLWGKFPFSRASAFIFYYSGSKVDNIIFSLKYEGNREIGIWMGHNIAYDLEGTDFFDDIDYIVPIPLAKKRLRQRGFNQSELIADGISEVSGVEVRRDVVERLFFHGSQTHLSHFERYKNVDGVFQVTDVSAIEGKHLLLVDDVITTGATMYSCANAIIKSCSNVKISIATFAASNRFRYEAI